MDQVGHADSTMTMDVAQLQKRFERSHGASFDRLVREPSEQVKALPTAVADAVGSVGARPQVGLVGPQR